MNSKRRLLSLGVASMVIASGLVAAFGTTAAHATTLPWAHDPHDVGTISFFDATGQRVLGGKVSDTPFAAFAEASHAGRAANPVGGVVADTKATLFGALPKSGSDPSAWTQEQMSGSTTFPDAAAPAPLNSATLPVVDLAGASLANLIADQPNLAVDAYAGLYELRIKTSGPGQTADATYDAADILVTGTGTSATWQQLNVLSATSVYLVIWPVSPVYHGTNVTITARVSPNVAGTVAFYDGSKLLATKPVSNGQVALASTAYVDGTHHFAVRFNPTDTTLYSFSVSPTTAYVVRVHPTTLKLAATASRIHYPTYVTFTATVSPSAAGTVRIYRNNVLWWAHTITSKAALRTNALRIGSYKFRATFTPSVPASYLASSSNTIALSVIK